MNIQYIYHPVVSEYLTQDYSIYIYMVRRVYYTYIPTYRVVYITAYSIYCTLHYLPLNNDMHMYMYTVCMYGSVGLIEKKKKIK